MADEDTSGQSYSFGTGGDPYSNPYALLALGGGMRGMGGDPYLAMLQPQMNYAQSLLGQSAQATPVASPWQSAARALSGVLGGYGMRQYGQQYQQMLAGEAEQGRRAVQDALGGITLQGAAPAPSATSAAPQATTAPTNLDGLLTAASAKSGIPKSVLVGLVSHESNFDPAAVNKDSGATGLGQVLPSTAAKPGYGMQPISQQDLLDPSKNIDFSSQYLAARGKDLFGDKWNPNDPQQIKAALNAYGDGTAGYADAVLAKGGASVPSLTVAQNDATASPQANVLAGWQAAQQLQIRAAQMAASPNPYVRASVPQLMQIANMLKTQGLYSQPQFDASTGQYWQRNNMTGELKALGAGQRPEGIAMSDLARLAPTAQADPNLLSPEDRQRLQTAITQIYKPTTKLDEKTGIQQTFWEKPPPGWVKTFMGLDDKGQPASTSSATTPAPQQTVSQAEAERAMFDKRVDAANTYMTNLQSQADATRTLQGDTQAIRDLVSQIRTGWGAETQARARSMLAALGANDPDQIYKAADAQAAEKMFLKLSFDAVRTLGAREPGSVISMTMQRFPSLESQPQAIQVMTRMLDMQQHYHEQRIAAMNDWLVNQTKTATTADHRFSEFKGIGDFASTGWDKANMPKTYSAAALLAARMPDEVWQKGLTAEQIDQAEQLAAQMYPSEITYSPPQKGR